MNELMMTGWLYEVGEMRECRQAYRSCVRSEIRRRDLGGREGVGGRLRGRRRFGAKEGSARATERSVRTVRVREGAGGDRSRVGEVVGGRGTERSGATERPERL